MATTAGRSSDGRRVIGSGGSDGPSRVPAKPVWRDGVCPRGREPDGTRAMRAGRSAGGQHVADHDGATTVLGIRFLTIRPAFRLHAAERSGLFAIVPFFVVRIRAMLA